MSRAVHYRRRSGFFDAAANVRDERERERRERRTDRSLRRAALAGQMRSKIVTALELKLRLYIYFGRKPKGISLDLPFLLLSDLLHWNWK